MALLLLLDRLVVLFLVLHLGDGHFRFRPARDVQLGGTSSSNEADAQSNDTSRATTAATPTTARNYRRPMCSETESCLYVALGYRFQFCDCPESRECPDDSDHSVWHQGVKYHFCSSAPRRVCGPGEVATLVEKLQTSVQCICPAGRKLVPSIRTNGNTNSTTTAYTCETIACQVSNVRATTCHGCGQRTVFRTLNTQQNGTSLSTRTPPPPPPLLHRTRRHPRHQ